MRLHSIVCSVVLMFALLATNTATAQWTFVRGDVNGDGSQNLQDPVLLLNYLFVPGSAVPPCLDACDMNDDGSLNLIDPINQLFALFQGGPPPSSPYPGCGPDPTADALSCDGPLSTCPPLNNTAPTITSTPILTATEAQPYSYDVDATDPDPGDSLTYSLTTAPLGATIDAGTGEITWTPTDLQNGPQSFTVEVTDSGSPALSDMQSFDVTVAGVNQQPTITSTPLLVAAEGFLYEYDVDATDADSADTLTYALTTAPVGATIDAGTGLVSWTPGATQVGINAFTVRATDDGVGMLFDTQSFMVTVSDNNQPPQIISTPILTGTELVPYSYDVDGSDPDPTDVLTYSLDVAPVGATIDPGTGVISWTPQADQTGLQDFTVRATDDGSGNLFGLQSFMVDVTDVNQGPTITSTAPLTATELVAYSYSVVATDPDPGDTLAYTLDVAPAGATISPAGLLEWVPTATQTGNQDFTVRVTDDGTPPEFTLQMFTVAVVDVNQPPVIGSTPVVTADEAQLYTYDVDATDPDPTDTITYSLDQAPAAATIDPTTGLISWTPAATDVGANAFTVRATDDGAGNLFDLQSFTVVVGDVNQLPVITSSPVLVAVEAMAYSYDVDASDPDIADTLTFSLDVAPAGAGIDPTTGLISWIPNASQTGMQMFTVRVTDDGVGSLFSTQSFSVDVTDVNQAPVFTSTPVLSAIEIQPYSYDVDATDPDGDTVTYSLATAPAGATIDPVSGLISWTPDATQTAGQDFTVQATDNGTGIMSEIQSFTVAVTDVNQPPFILSLPVTDATELVLYEYDVNGDDPDPGDTWQYTLEEAPAAAAINASTGEITWTPSAMDAGSHFFRVRQTDDGTPPMFTEQTFTVTVADVNQPPTITSSPVLTGSELVAYTYDVDATDVDTGTTLTYSLDTAPAGAVIDAGTGLIEWTPDTTQFGPQSFTVRATDDGVGMLSATQSFTVDVTDVNQAPTFTSTPATSADEGVAYAHTITTMDPDLGDTLTLTLPTAPAGVAFDAVAGTIDWTPTFADVGTADFTLRVNDGTVDVDQVWQVVVSASPNMAPTITSTAVTTASIGIDYLYEVLADDANPGDTLTYSLEVAPAGASINSFGVLTWSAAAADLGFHDFTVRVTDDGTNNLFVEQSFVVEVRYRVNCGELTNLFVDNQGNVWVPDFGFDNPASEIFSSGSPIGGTLNDSLYQKERLFLSPPGSYSLPLPAGPEYYTVRLLFGELTFAASGARVFDVDVEGAPLLAAYDPFAAAGGQFIAEDEVFELFSSDGTFTLEFFQGAAGNPKLSGIEISLSGAGNVAPIFTSTAPLDATEGMAYAYPALATDGNVADPLAYSLEVAPVGATIDAMSGLVEWTPPLASAGPHDFTLRATDAGGLLVEQSFTVNVSTDMNVAPVITSTPPMPETATVAVEYVYDVDAMDGNATQTLTYSLQAGPASAAIDPATGALTWTPVGTELGTQSFTVRVTDDGAMPLFAEQTFMVDTRYRINCGEPTATYTASNGAQWSADFGYDNAANEIFSVTTTVGNTSDQPLFQTERFSFSPPFTYSLDVPAAPSAYTVILFFAEIGLNNPGDRIFDVTLEGAPILTGLDLVATYGADQAAILFYEPRVVDGVVDISFLQGAADFPKVSAIEVGVTGTPNTAPTITSTAPTRGTVGINYQYDAAATDPDLGDPLLFTLETAPAAATIDGATGSVSWTPQMADAGMNPFVIRVTDGHGAFDEQSFSVDVSTTPVNEAPQITSIAPTLGTVSAPYSYDVDAVDPNAGDTVTYALTTAPTGATIDAGTGLVSWTPTADDLGSNAFTVTATDQDLAVGDQSFSVNVCYRINCGELTTNFNDTAGAVWSTDFGFDNDPNDTFAITNPIDLTDDDAIFQVERFITAQPSMTYTLPLPVGVTEVDVDLLFTESFFTGVGQRSFDVTIEGDVALDDFDIRQATGARYRATTRSFEAYVLDGTLHITFLEDVADHPKINGIQVCVGTVTNVAPMFTSTPGTSANEGVPYSYDADATDVNLGDELTFSLEVAPAGAVIDASTGLVSWTPPSAGSDAFVVRVTDLDGLFVEQSFTVDVFVAGNVPPSFTSTAPSPALASVQVEFLYDADATDPNTGQTLTYSIVSGPVNAMIDAGTGLFSWTPMGTEIGDQTFTIRVTDDDATPMFAEQTFIVTTRYRINTGSTAEYTAMDGGVWAADFGFDTDPLQTFSVTTGIGGTEDDTIYQSERYSDVTITYSLPVPAGNNVYDVALHMSEIGLTGNGARQFDVRLEGQEVLTDYDIFATYGGNQAAIEAYSVRISDGMLTLVLDLGSASLPKIAGIEVAPSGAPNGAPTITSTAPTAAVEGTPFGYQATATDPNIGDPTTFSLLVAPTGATVDPTSGVFSWTPSMAQLGLQSFTLRATDTHGAFDEQVFDVNVTSGPMNVAPQLTTTAPLTAPVGGPYDYDVDATDPNAGDTLVYSLIVAPTGATIDSATGLIMWDPTAAQFGDNDFTVRVTDDALAMDEQSFTVAVSYRINCGELTLPYTDSAGDVWSTDFGYDNDPADVFGITAGIDMTTDDTLFQEERFFLGMGGGYALGLPAGVTEVQVELLFAESFFQAAGERIFDVDLEGDLALDDLDLWDENMARYSAISRVFDVYVFDEELLVSIRTQSANFGKINGIRVTPGTVVNAGPTITSTAVVDGETGGGYSYDVDATDPNLGDVQTYTLEVAPAGASIDPVTGLISWAPTVVGMESFTVRSTDAMGLFDEQSFVVNVVSGTPAAPQITAPAGPLFGTVSALFSYQVDATDANMNDTLTYSIMAGPAGAMIDSATGLISWTPTSTDMGLNTITVRVTDNSASMLFDEQDYDVPVSYRINCGETSTPFTDADGAVWAVDFGFNNPGEVFTRGGAINNTVNDTLFLSERFTLGLDFTYDLAIPNATYTVRLHFAETFFTMVDERQFHVSLEGTQELTDYDIIDVATVPAANAGVAPKNWALTEEFTAVVSDGMLTIQFAEGSFNHPKISAIEVLVP